MSKSAFKSLVSSIPGTSRVMERIVEMDRREIAKSLSDCTGGVTEKEVIDMIVDMEDDVVEQLGDEHGKETEYVLRLQTHEGLLKVLSDEVDNEQEKR